MMATQNNYLAVSRRALDLEDYIDVARRHAGWIAGPTFAGMVISICVAFFLPNMYESQATMRITPGQISEDLVKSTVTQQLNDRIVQMQSDIMSRGGLSAIITDPRFNLYPKERANQPLEDVIEAMRHDIHISINNIDAGTKRGGASTFTITFAYPERLKTQQVVQALVTQFEDRNTILQHNQQTTLTSFFGDELTTATANLQKANEALTSFRNANQGRLPEQSPMNMANLTSLTNQVSGINDQLNRLDFERARLETSLSTLKSQRTFAEGLAQEPTGSSLFSSPSFRVNEDLVSVNKMIDAGELKMQDLLQHFKPAYPEVKALEGQLKVLKKRRDDLQAKQEKDQADEAAKPKETIKKSTNTQAIQAQLNIDGQIDQTNTQLKIIATDRANKVKDFDRLTKEIEDYRAKLAATSGIEAQYADLVRESQNAALVYNDTLKKKELTAQSGDLIQRKATETLDVLDPPSAPTNPTKPNRWEYVGVGFGVSIFLGVALAGLQEAKDTSLKNLKDVRAYTNLPVLSSIPLLENTMLVKRKKRISYLIWSAAIIIGIIAICASLFYYSTVTKAS